jgi:hypothetical protein
MKINSNHLGHWVRWFDVDRRQTINGRESDRIEAKCKGEAKSMKFIHYFLLALLVFQSINTIHMEETNDLNGNEERSEIEESTRNAMHLEMTSSLSSSTSTL